MRICSAHVRAASSKARTSSRRRSRSCSSFSSQSSLNIAIAATEPSHSSDLDPYVVGHGLLYGGAVGASELQAPDVGHRIIAAVAWRRDGFSPAPPRPRRKGSHPARLPHDRTRRAAGPLLGGG